MTNIKIWHLLSVAFFFTWLGVFIGFNATDYEITFEADEEIRAIFEQMSNVTVAQRVHELDKELALCQNDLMYAQAEVILLS